MNKSIAHLRRINSATCTIALVALSIGPTLLAQSNTFPTTGDVGIGTTAPGASVDIVTAGAGPLLRLAGSSSTGYGYIQFGRSATATNNWHIGSENDGTFRIWNGNWGAGSLNTTFSANSSVGIGLTNPGAKLDVNGSVNIVNAGWLTFGYYTGGAASVSGINFGFGSQITRRGSDGHLKYEAQNGVHEFVGNVGIGVSNPTQKLSVYGAIRAKEVIVDTAWSDYVFEEKYRLPTLAEVEVQIKTQKHLDGIPSAKEVAEKGIRIGDIEAKLLAKIEELTLHQIEQEKRLSEQQSELSTLKEENAAMKAHFGIK